MIACAARLNVRIRCGLIRGGQAARQAVDHVLVERLQVRDLRRTPARSRAPADSGWSASEPLSNATAKNPNTLSATV